MDEVADRAWEAHVAGATEVCMQGGIDPELPVTGYADLVRAVKARVPSMHVHAFSPMEIANGVTRSGLSVREWLTARGRPVWARSRVPPRRSSTMRCAGC